MAVQSDGAVLIGGQFTSVNGSSQSHLARLATNGALDLTFSIGTGTDNDVYALAVQTNGSVLVGGAFTNFNGTAFGRLVRLAADGSVDASFVTGTGANGAIRTIAVMTDGRIVIAGDFTADRKSTRLNSSH